MWKAFLQSIWLIETAHVSRTEFPRTVTAKLCGKALIAILRALSKLEGVSRGGKAERMRRTCRGRERAKKGRPSD